MKISKVIRIHFNGIELYLTRVTLTIIKRLQIKFFLFLKFQSNFPLGLSDFKIK